MIAKALFTEPVEQQARYDEQLRHGLRGAAGLGDDVENGVVKVDDVEQSGHALRVDIVLNEDARAARALLAEVVVMEVAKRLLNGDRAESAAADAEHDEVFRGFAHERSRFEDGVDYGGHRLIEIAPAHHVALRVSRFKSGFEPGLHIGDLLLGDAVLANGS